MPSNAVPISATALPAQTGAAAATAFMLLLAQGLVLLAGWNAVLRPAAELPITPFYVMAPFLLVGLWLSQRWFQNWFAWSLLIFAYGVLVGSVYGVPLAVQLSQLIKYVQLLVFFGLLRWMQNAGPQGLAALNRLVGVLVVMVLAFAVLQLLTGFEFPTVRNEESALWLNGFFFTPNDVALFLGGALCLVLTSSASLMSKGLILVLITALNLRNDAKAVLLATLLMLGMLGVLKLCKLLKMRPLMGLLLLVVMVPLVVLMLSETVYEIQDSEFDFFQLFLDPFQRIVDLEPYELGGSIFDRTDALIHALRAMQSMHWLGLGPGGSVHTLSLPQFELLTAKSLHNALAELLVDLGPAALAVAALISRPLWRSLWDKSCSRPNQARLLLVAASPMLSVSQSSGFISNYAFWLTAYVIWFAPSPQSTNTRHKVPRRESLKADIPHIEPKA